MQPGDLKIGMYLKNEGPGTLPLYDNDFTQPPSYQVPVGDVIGQIGDIDNGPDGTAVFFIATQKEIDAAPWKDKVVNFLTSWLPDTQPGFAAKFVDIQSHVTDAQIGVQANAIDNAKANGDNIANEIQRIEKDILDSILGGWSIWEVIGIFGAGYVLLNWKQFFKPR
jgi:hypothetical protein